MSNWIYVNVMSSGGANKEGANALRSCANLVSFIPAVVRLIKSSSPCR
jgi:hypothetical protein